MTPRPITAAELIAELDARRGKHVAGRYALVGDGAPRPVSVPADVRSFHAAKANS